MLEESISFAIVNGRFPHIGHTLFDCWERPEFMTYMEGLLQHNPHRRGFPSDVASALASLAIERDMEFPNFTQADRDF
jgi:hypothetical protein